MKKFQTPIKWIAEFQFIDETVDTSWSVRGLSSTSVTINFEPKFNLIPSTSEPAFLLGH